MEHTGISEERLSSQLSNMFNVRGTVVCLRQGT